jgi:hypothetical protein
MASLLRHCSLFRPYLQYLKLKLTYHYHVLIMILNPLPIPHDIILMSFLTIPELSTDKDLSHTCNLVSTDLSFLHSTAQSTHLT